MSRPAEQEILEILDAYKDAPMVNPNKVYAPYAYSRKDVHYRENRRHAILRQRPFPRGWT